MHPGEPDAPFDGLWMVWWYLFHTELQKQFPFCLSGKNSMVQQAVSHVFRETNHCQAKRGSSD